jgi:hypothetical protein
MVQSFDGAAENAKASFFFTLSADTMANSGVIWTTILRMLGFSFYFLHQVHLLRYDIRSVGQDSAQVIALH